MAAGAITAGGCLGILIPPSVLLIVYGATAGVSVVQLYAGAFFPGIMLAGLYVGYVIIVAKIKPEWAPPLPNEERLVALPPLSKALQPRSPNALLGLASGLLRPAPGVPFSKVAGQFLIALLPFIAVAALLGYSYAQFTAPLARGVHRGPAGNGRRFRHRAELDRIRPRRTEGRGRPRRTQGRG